jgi:hypothetical protein
VASVIGGGLRARRAANLNQGLRASLRHVGILAAAMTMGQVLVMAGLLDLVVHSPRVAYIPPAYIVGVILASVLVVLSVAAAWSGRRWLVAAAVGGVAAAAAFCSLAHPVASAIGPMWVVLAVLAGLALVVLLPLTRRAERPPASLLWLPCLALAVALVEELALESGRPIYDLLPLPAIHEVILLYPYGTYLSFAPVLVAACWLVTDVRPLAAVALQFLLMRVIYAAFDAHFAQEIWTQVAIFVGLPLTLTFALAWLLRHRARTAPPTIG